jgi:single-strand DNA-binding protein
MADLSIAVIVGRLTKNSELKYTSGGSPICSFAVATSSRKKKGDQWVDEASFWDVELWGKQGESLNQYLVKGKQVAIEGTMRQDRWEKDGQPRMKVVIGANSVQLLGGGQDKQPAKEEPRRKSPYGPDGAARQAQSADGFTDQVPF